MTQAPRALTVANVLKIHRRQLSEFGGADGVRDHNLLESAVARGSSPYHEDELAAAAALWEGLVRNHPFVDGNKRTGTAAMLVFLRLNGWHLSATDAEMIAFVLGGLENGTFNKIAAEEFIRKYALTQPAR